MTTWRSSCSSNEMASGFLSTWRMPVHERCSCWYFVANQARGPAAAQRKAKRDAKTPCTKKEESFGWRVLEFLGIGMLSYARLGTNCSHIPWESSLANTRHSTDVISSRPWSFISVFWSIMGSNRAHKR